MLKGQAARRLICVAKHVAGNTGCKANMSLKSHTTASQVSNPAPEAPEECQGDSKLGYGAAAIGGVGGLFLVPAGIAALGFGPAGAAAGSIASSMMSASATYGFGAGVVGALQSAGAAGLALGTKVAIAGAAGAASYASGKSVSSDAKAASQVSNPAPEAPEECQGDSKLGYGAAAIGGVGALFLVPAGIAALGFGPAGIAAGSFASSMMSASATYGIGAGAVGALQSAGAAGLALGTKVAIAGVAGAASYASGKSVSSDAKASKSNQH